MQGKGIPRLYVLGPGAPLQLGEKRDTGKGMRNADFGKDSFLLCENSILNLRIIRIFFVHLFFGDPHEHVEKLPSDNLGP